LKPLRSMVALSHPVAATPPTFCQSLWRRVVLPGHRDQASGCGFRLL
jgi:hypothetical protein